MQFQEKRSIVFVITNLVVTTAYWLIVISNWYQQLSQPVADLPFWALVILIFIPVQIITRIIIMIVLATVNAATGETQPIDLEDELDKLIDLKATRIFYHFFMASVIVGLVLLACGLPALSLVITIGTSMLIAGIIGDLSKLILYRQGV